MCKVSVIVPVYNVEEYLDQCLDSLVHQTLREIEILVINDGTQDNSQAIIDRYVKRYPQIIKSYQKENGGLSSARNFGLTRAVGEYIAFVDSDDFVDVNMYEHMYQKAKEQDFDLVVCDFNELRKHTVLPCSCKINDDLLSHDAVKKAMIDFYPSAWNKLYRKRLLDHTHITFKEGVWFEDVEFIYRLLPYVDTIGVVHEPFYQYLIRTGSITATSDVRIYHYIDNWNGIVEYYHKHGIYEEYREILEYCYVRYLFATFVKAAAKMRFNDFKIAVVSAKENVSKNFPNYRKNRYLKKKSFKNLYLKYFSVLVAIMIYFKYHS